MRLVSLFLILGLCSRPFALSRNEQREWTTEPKASVVRRIEAGSDTTPYLIIPKDGKDRDLLDRLKTTIMSTTRTSDVANWTTDGQLKWYYADLTASEVTNLERNDDIDYITEDKPLIPLRAMPTKLSDNFTNFADSTSKPTLSKRGQKWYHQPNRVIWTFPVDELKVISTPNGKDWRFRSEYVYAAEAGENIHIFHIEYVRSSLTWLENFPSLNLLFTNLVYMQGIMSGYDEVSDLLFPPDAMLHQDH